MSRKPRLFEVEQPSRPGLTGGDVLVLLGVAGVIYGGVRLAILSPQVVRGPEISLAPTALPYYAGLSILRMLAAYLLSISFSLVYGRLAAGSRAAERVLMPLLDVLQSVPILSFLPLVLLSLTAVLPENTAVEIASVVLIFTSQAWNLTYAWYQSLKTIPKDMQEASTIFHLNSWLRFKTLELPFAAISLIWNSVMSWAGGWFFLMAAEIFTVGQRDFRLPGLGAYLQEAANRGDGNALGLGILALVLIVVLLDQLAWRPLLAWADRFKVEMVESEHPPTSWFFDLLHSSSLVGRMQEKLWRPAVEGLDDMLLRRFPTRFEWLPKLNGRPAGMYFLGFLGSALLAYGIYRAGGMLLSMPFSVWAEIGLDLAATFLRVTIALLVALAWTIPLGVVIGTQPGLAALLQPVVQVIASIPATALFPALLLVLLNFPGGLELAAVLLMLMGTQWYLLFNVIAGATAIPQDLKYTAAMLRLNGWQRWRTLILPALFPYVVTGAITASGGAWNASIVAEHVTVGGKTLFATGIGALIARATAEGNYPLLLAGTLSMILAVVFINRLLWRRLYRLAEQRYRME